MPGSASAARRAATTRANARSGEVGAVGCLLWLAWDMLYLGYLIHGIATALSPTSGKVRKELLGPEERRKSKR